MPVSEGRINHRTSESLQTPAAQVINYMIADARLQCATLNGLPVFETTNKNNSVGCHFQTGSPTFQMKMESDYCPKGIEEVAISGRNTKFKDGKGSSIGKRYQSDDYAGATFSPGYSDVVYVSGAKKVGGNQFIDGSVVCK